MATKPGRAAAAVLLLTLLAALHAAARNNNNNNENRNPGGGGGDPGAFFAGMPRFSGGGVPGSGRFFGGWGEGGLGYRRGVVVPPSTVCPQDGPCRGKRLTCPPRCFRTFSYGGKNGGGGGGGGGCSFDCTERCAATC